MLQVIHEPISGASGYNILMTGASYSSHLRGQYSFLLFFFMHIDIQDTS